MEIDGAGLDALTAELDAARSLLDEGKPTQALQLLESLDRRGAELSESDAVQTFRARVAVTQSLALVEVTGRLPDALSLLDEATHRIADPRHPVLVAIHGQRAYTLYRSGRLEEAAASFDAAVDLAEVAIPLDLVNVLMNRANLRMELGELREAGEDLTRVIEVAGQAGISDRVWKAQHNLGYVDFLAGRIPQALELMQDSMRAQSGEIHPISLLDRARVLREAGLHREADSLLESAARQFGGERAIQDLAETELARAECALLSGNAADAEAFARSAREHFAVRHNLRWQRRAELLMLKCERARLEDDWPPTSSTRLGGLAARARDLADLCAAEERDDLADQAAMLALEAELRSGGSNAPVEINLLPTDAVAQRLAKREVAALAAWADGDASQAMREIKRGVDDLSRFQNRYGSLDLRTATATHGQALARLALDLALETDDPEIVFDAIERPRAASTRLPRLSPPQDDIAAGWLGELRQVEEQIRGLEGESRDNETLHRLRAKALQLTDDIRSRSWQLTGRTSSRASIAVSAEEIVTDLTRGQAWVSYAQHRGRWLAVVVEERGARSYDLGEISEGVELLRQIRADLDVLAAGRLAETMRTAVRRHLDAALARLDALLVLPLNVNDRRLTISAGGMLTVLPWSLLPSRLGIPTVLTPSATAWVERQGIDVDPAVSVVAVAGPDVPGAAREVQGVMNRWATASALTGERASAAGLTSALGTADLLHVAAHGVHRHDNPLFSSLRLSDGPLFAHELDALVKVPDCVVLSACEVGLSTLRPGDEGLGLTSALLHFGTKSVVSGVARVRDDIATETMLLFHDALSRGADVASALASAQSAVRDADAPIPFVCFGATWSVA